MKLTKLLFLVLALSSASLFATTFTNPGTIEVGDEQDVSEGEVNCHDGDTVILHKGDFLGIQAAATLSPDMTPANEFSFYFDTNKYLRRNPSDWASADAGIVGHFFFSRMWVFAQDVGITKLYCDTLTGETNYDIKKKTIIIDVQP
ncbi:MAG: hypothetical protein K2W97_04120 [Chthoniobacterales bacterium]|nr:hypothetical protein [Chthoniobacterales bacterium]